MDITPDLLLRSFAYGTGGVIIGTLYTIFSQFNSTDMSNMLSIPYNYIQQNNELLEVMVLLNDDFMRLDKVAYFRTTSAIDEICHIHDIIHRNKELATIEHRVDAFVHFRIAKKSIQRFLNVAEEVDNAQNVIKIQGLLKRVMHCLENEMHYILIMTRDLM